jgi:hypothetical protein
VEAELRTEFSLAFKVGGQRAVAKVATVRVATAGRSALTVGLQQGRASPSCGQDLGVEHMSTIMRNPHFRSWEFPTLG